MNYEWKIKHNFNNNLLLLKQQEMKLNDNEFDNFINHKGKIRNPYQLKNMDKIVDRIQTAILNNEKVVLYGDYDADGIMATTIMMLGLLQIGANVDYDIPNRFTDGYGISQRQIDKAIQNQVNLIISVDTGIAEHESIKKAQDNGIDVIVTDHHPWNSDTLPCELVVDPFIDKSYEFPYICGAMVAYKVIRALIPEIKLLNNDLNKQLIAFATIATISDVMSLNDENRLFVYNGLKLINNNNNCGLKALLKALNLNKEITESDIGFSIAPCINAVGRLENANQVVELFLSDDEIQAEKIANKIIQLNEKRKVLTNDFIANLSIHDTPVIIEVAKNIPAGILGIAANRIAHKYQKPCFILGKSNGRLGGSGRSINNYNISQNILLNKDLDIDGGGHAAACALSIAEKDFEVFKQRCYDNYMSFLQDNVTDVPQLLIDFSINFNQISFPLIDDINKFRPFGQGNPEIVFCTKNIKILEKKILGKNKNTVKFTLLNNDSILEAICFNELKDYFVNNFDDAEYIDMVYTITINEFRGRKSIQLMPIDFKRVDDIE